MTLLLAVVGAVAFVSAVAAVPLIMRFAVNRRLLDFPDEYRRAHDTAVPRLGGVAGFAGLLLALGAGVVAGKIAGVGPANLAPHAAHLLAASAILFGIGLLDDLHGV